VQKTLPPCTIWRTVRAAYLLKGFLDKISERRQEFAIRNAGPIFFVEKCAIVDYFWENLKRGSSHILARQNPGKGPQMGQILSKRRASGYGNGKIHEKGPKWVKFNENEPPQIIYTGQYMKRPQMGQISLKRAALNYKHGPIHEKGPNGSNPTETSRLKL